MAARRMRRPAGRERTNLLSSCHSSSSRPTSSTAMSLGLPAALFVEEGHGAPSLVGVRPRRGSPVRARRGSPGPGSSAAGLAGPMGPARPPGSPRPPAGRPPRRRRGPRTPPWSSWSSAVTVLSRSSWVSTGTPSRLAQRLDLGQDGLGRRTERAVERQGQADDRPPRRRPHRPGRASVGVLVGAMAGPVHRPVGGGDGPGIVTDRDPDPFRRPRSRAMYPPGGGDRAVSPRRRFARRRDSRSQWPPAVTPPIPAAWPWPGRAAASRPAGSLPPA